MDIGRDPGLSERGSGAYRYRLLPENSAIVISVVAVWRILALALPDEVLALVQRLSKPKRKGSARDDT